MNINNNDMRKDSIALRDYFRTLTRGEALLLMERLVKGCKVQRGTIYHWRQGLSRIPELYKDKIEEIAGTRIFDRIEESEK